MKFVGIKNNNIVVISDNIFKNNELEIVKLPFELEILNNFELLNYKYKDHSFKLKKELKKAKNLRVAIITNFKMKCGIATYSDFLYSNLIDKFADFKFFIEKNDFPTGPNNIIGEKTYSEDKFITCWERGKSLSNLVNNIKKYDPDVILIQHEFGIFPNARYWISLLNQLSEYRIITTMHSVFHHRDKTICEAAMPEIVVHLEGARAVLKDEKNIPGKVYVIPHGSFPIVSKEKLWNFYKSDYTFVQFGFGFEYKGFENSIIAASILKKKYNDVYFTALFSQSDFNMLGHDNYYNKLMLLIKEHNLEENVGIIRGFQSDNTLDSYLRTNKVAVFPYISHSEHEVWGASGAARFAMTKNIPIITSNVNHFSDLPSIKAETPDKMAEELDKLFSDNNLINTQLKIQEKYISDTAWNKVAEMYIELLEC